MTELRKMQNRLEFGKEEEEAGAFDETRGLGMINSNASGKIRAAAAESRGKGELQSREKLSLTFSMSELSDFHSPSFYLHSQNVKEKSEQTCESESSFLIVILLWRRREFWNCLFPIVHAYSRNRVG